MLREAKISPESTQNRLTNENGAARLDNGRLVQSFLNDRGKKATGTARHSQVHDRVGNK